ncbi:aldehyde dehydrogenase family protein [Pelagibius litoralis]|uniref:Aldehyde dehydrogenase family protein n=2 Tax=Pelagibius litoralis TaxID=374515 RepID=A0A967KFJ3_9PROT|nr:aldehyde dehydrogenase family protein [Pelagibius litoralis]
MNALVSNDRLQDDHLILRESPATGEVVSREHSHDRDQCLRFAARAAAAFPRWSATPAVERAEHLVAVAALLEERADSFRLAMIEETGAPVKWATHNITFAARLLRGVASYAGLLDQPEIIHDENGFVSRVERAPCGVCLGITPWNAPLILGMRAIAAPLLCGNTVLLKGNEFAPRTFRLLGEAVRDAGIGEDVARVLICPEDESEAIVDALIETPVVRRINFTGSTRVGRRVAELCARHLKRPLLELGGQAPMLVLQNADLDLAAKAAASGGYLNQGQVCMSTERIIVDDVVADDLIERIDALRTGLTLGDPTDPTSDLGPVINISAAERLSGLVSDAISKGARLVGGGTMGDAFFQPTLLDRVEPDMRLYNEEAFGPILSVTRVRNGEEAVTVANDSEYGLAASVYCRDVRRAESVARQIHTGICHINRSTVDDDPHAPFGGVKSSGYGRFGGRWALDEFTELRWISCTAGS